MIEKLILVFSVFLMCLTVLWAFIFLVKYQAILLLNLFSMNEMSDAYFLSITITTVIIGCSIGILVDLLNK